MEQQANPRSPEPAAESELIADFMRDTVAFMEDVMEVMTQLIASHGELVEIVEGMSRELEAVSVQRSRIDGFAPADAVAVDGRAQQRLRGAAALASVPPESSLRRHSRASSG